jgi:hypothetical protein
MKKYIFSLIIIFCLATQFINAQQVDPNRVQRGQRGYVPEPKYKTTTYIGLHDVQNEINIIVPKVVKELKLDDFQKEIFKNLLTQKLEDENSILEDKRNTRETRRKKTLERGKQFIKSLSEIFSKEQVDEFNVMSFSESKDEKKARKRKGKKNNK